VDAMRRIGPDALVGVVFSKGLQRSGDSLQRFQIRLLASQDRQQAIDVAARRQFLLLPRKAEQLAKAIVPAVNKLGERVSGECGHGIRWIPSRVYPRLKVRLGYYSFASHSKNLFH